mgnify:CR=1 FL=1
MKFAHIALIISDLDQSAQFYEGLLGLKRITRPDLGFDGVWFGLDEGQEIHLMLLDNPYLDCSRPAHGGRDNHLALQVDDFELIRSRIECAGIRYTMSKSGRQALFCRDPDGNTLELMT